MALLPLAVSGDFRLNARRMQTALIGRSALRASRFAYGYWPMLGTTDPGQIGEAAAADSLVLSREAWCRLRVAARPEPLP